MFMDDPPPVELVETKATSIAECGFSRLRDWATMKLMNQVSGIEELYHSSCGRHLALAFRAALDCARRLWGLRGPWRGLECVMADSRQPIIKS